MFRIACLAVLLAVASSCAAAPAALDTPTASPQAGFATTVPATLTWDDMPVYPGAEVDWSALTYEGVSPEGVYSEWRRYKTTDGLDEVAAFYREEMVRRGWAQILWGPLEPSLLDWVMVGGTYVKNGGRDRAAVEITDQKDGVVRIALLRAAG